MDAIIRVKQTDAKKKLSGSFAVVVYLNTTRAKGKTVGSLSNAGPLIFNGIGFNIVDWPKL